VRPRAMAAMDIDSARGKNHAGSPGARDARRKSPRGSVGALGRSSPDAVAKAKRAASDAPERRVLFADSALKPSGDAEGAALDDFGEHGIHILVNFLFDVPDMQTEKRERQHLFLAILKLAEDQGIEFAVPVKIPETPPDIAGSVN